jgi:carboxylesterase
VIIGVVTVALLWAASPRLRPHPDPAADYAQALARYERLRAEDGPEVSGECGTRLLTHGHRTGRAIVLLHGLTNCPAQFDSLARLFFAEGANVLVPRLPRHGFADRMTEALARSDAAELCVFTDRAIDITNGLGDSVTVAGLSTGGVMAAWAGQERREVDRAIVIAPVLGMVYAPGPLTRLAARLMDVLPNAFLWWDRKAKQQLGGPKHVYPRFATRAIAASLDIGTVTLSHARRSAPACRELVMVTIGGDPAVDNARCAELVRSWRKGGREVTAYEFPADLRLSHDVVDPEQVGGNPAITYPVLIRLIGGG